MKRTTPKPVECDVHLKYLCPTCGQAHWLSMREAKTKNYKVVCYCDSVFTVKRIKNFKLIYASQKSPKAEETKPTIHTTENTTANKTIPIDNNMLHKARDILVGYGFKPSEAEDALLASYNNSPVHTYIDLVKQTLASMRS